MDPDVFHPNRYSLLRGNLLVVAAILLSLWLSDFPNNHATLWLLLPCAMVLAGSVETVRCIQRRWTWRHASVILCLYMDLMAATLVFFLFLYPYVLSWNPRR